MGNLSVKKLERENELEAEVKRKRDQLEQECKAKLTKTLQSGAKRVFDPGGAHVQADGVDMDKSDKSDLFPYYDAAWAHNDSVIQVKAASARSEIRTADCTRIVAEDEVKRHDMGHLLHVGYVGHMVGEEALKMIEHADKNKDGVVDFDEFKQVWYRKVLTTNDQYIHRVFDVFDDNGDGHIDAAELGQILFPKDEDGGDGSAGDPTSPDEEARLSKADEDDDEDEDGGQGVIASIKKMIGEVDKNGDGKIDFAEFKSAMKEDLEAGKWGMADEGNYGGMIGPKITE